MVTKAGLDLDARRFKRLCHVLAWTTWLAVAGLAAALTIPLALGVGRPLLVFAAAWSSAPFYMLGLWILGALFNDISKESVGMAAVSRALRGVGLAMAAGAMMSVLGSPLLLLWAGASLSLARFDIPALAAGLTGGALIALSSLLAKAAALEARAAALQAELDSFI